ncbi:hypothetical protein Tsubulata_048846 [Turnera subulata]|uniref:Uncharacterized protein n=1 Tax=Turnera subulata TaxID=218843 RepID=A0A9Q0GC92_9ROSI|nr:hypothetical protein Tsubulata_048846 [Turnera subulata]
MQPLTKTGQPLMSAYTDAEPTWHCIESNSTSCSSSSDICKIRRHEWAWDAGSPQTIISEWPRRRRLSRFATIRSRQAPCFLASSSLSRRLQVALAAASCSTAAVAALSLPRALHRHQPFAQRLARGCSSVAPLAASRSTSLSSSTQRATSSRRLRLLPVPVTARATLPARCAVPPRSSSRRVASRR